MIGVSSKGNFDKTYSFLEKISGGDIFKGLDKGADSGVKALATATPRDDGDTANSWVSNVSHSSGTHTIDWDNTHENHGVNIAILIQYGHGTGTGGYVPGYDFINPAIGPVMDKITDDVWKKVKNG